MKFRYEFDIRKSPRQISHPQKLFLIGSCFTENIGEKLKRAKFQVLENPHGILFNPVSVSEAMMDCVVGKKYEATDLFHNNEAWHSWKHHSRFSHPAKEEAVLKINESIGEAQQFLKHADHIMITLGSAWTYMLTDKADGKEGTVVANNHKAPGDWFRKKLLSPDEVCQLLLSACQKINAFNSGVQFIFTISPVRHLREGVVENNRSKAVLIQAMHTLVEELHNAYYFPAYELVIDDLRDYRFYAEDLVHPNYFATQYVWEKFVDACMSADTKQLMEQLHSIQLAYRHRAFNENSEQHKAFLRTHYEKARQLQEKYPYLDLNKELEYFRS